jgi:hypothetical protein
VTSNFVVLIDSRHFIFSKVLRWQHIFICHVKILYTFQSHITNLKPLLSKWESNTMCLGLTCWKDICKHIWKHMWHVFMCTSGILLYLFLNFKKITPKIPVSCWVFWKFSLSLINTCIQHMTVTCIQARTPIPPLHMESMNPSHVYWKPIMGQTLNKDE